LPHKSCLFPCYLLVSQPSALAVSLYSVSPVHQMRRLVAAAGPSASSLLRGFATAATEPARVAVVGGGVAGLAAAKALLNHGVACTLLDMGEHGVGGRSAAGRARRGLPGMTLCCRRMQADETHASCCAE